MNEQWPSERYAEQQEVLADPSFKTAQDFLNFLKLAHIKIKDLDKVTNWIAEQDGNLAELEHRTAQLADEFLPGISDGHPLLTTLACAVALAHTPSLKTWEKVTAFKYHSSQLDHWLSEAMIAYAEFHPPACIAYVALAKEVFAALENLSLQSKSDHINNQRANAWAYWGECRGQLDEIWWNLRGWHGFMTYEDERALFHVFYKLNSGEFIRTISKSANPYLVSGLLFVASIGTYYPQFSEWKRMIVAAPVAFESDGKWNGSVLMPLLLVEARNQLLQARQSIRNPDSTLDELNVIRLEIARTADFIADALAKRQDALPLFTRWTAWLMRQSIGATEKEITDVKSPTFADYALLDAIGRNLRGKTLQQTSPDDALSWEPWCYRCVLALFAYNKYIPVPDWSSYIDEWKLAPEDWASKKGGLLRTRASIITSLSKDIPGEPANLLAYPITQSSAPVKSWMDLWNAAVTLREIVEFGDADATNDEYNSRREAGQLLLLLFQIGLAIFDQAAAHITDKHSIEARSLANFFKALISATYEMRDIDITLNRDVWLSITQHLAVRRMIWESPSGKNNTSLNFQVFTVDDAPTLSDILSNAKNDVTELVNILQSLMLNSPNGSSLKDHLDYASIDLSKTLHSIRCLNKYHPYKYPIDESQLKKLASH